MEMAVAFGRELQQERERRGVSLDAVAEGTKVSPKYLRALERDDMSELPGGVFNKGFVRSYCRYLGLNEDEWVARFSQATQTAAGDVDWTAFAENVKRNRVRTSPQMRRRWWGVALMLVVLAAAAWAMWRYVVRSRWQVDPAPVRGSVTLPAPELPQALPKPVRAGRKSARTPHEKA